ncbi:hypothetical protein CRG98_001803 [Punica granatum]|uniref:Metallo-beta-lactamase domain-containing protein n=1 Tax=Punica granatum TaxID=22663 RepID=A0A2I0LAY0_PUNGR|nr:hypothetical protein CRG98_001803 [Punica granatum]
MAAAHKLGVIFRNPSNDAEFLLYRQPRPPKFGEGGDYDLYSDSDLWDLPSTTELNPIAAGVVEPPILVPDLPSLPPAVVFGDSEFQYSDLSWARQVLGRVGLGVADVGDWKFFKCVEEAEFGPGPPINFVFVEAKLLHKNPILREPTKFQLTSTIRFQEYPPGVVVIPMRSKTAKPFHTTNLVVCAPENDSGECKDSSFVASGDALIVDPGCRSESLEELREIVAALPRRLIVFASHHHRDHINGLSVIQKTNPDSILLAHKSTMSRIHKVDGY